MAKNIIGETNERHRPDESDFEYIKNWPGHMKRCLKELFGSMSTPKQLINSPGSLLGKRLTRVGNRNITFVIYKDKGGNEIFDGHVLFDGNYHWVMSISLQNGQYLFCCNIGYNHELTQELFSGMEIIGFENDHQHLLECD